MSLLDRRFQWPKIANTLFQYIGTLRAKSAKARSSVPVSTFAGRQALVAKRLDMALFAVLACEPQFNERSDTFIISMLWIQLSWWSMSQIKGLTSARGESL